MTDGFRPAWQLAFVVFGIPIVFNGCAHGRGEEPFHSATMPDPGGCYMLVYEEPTFMGAWEFINGPVKYTTLEELPFRANWRRRIRSVQVGPAASVTIWEGDAFRGHRKRYRRIAGTPCSAER